MAAAAMYFAPLKIASNGLAPAGHLRTLPYQNEKR